MNKIFQHINGNTFKLNETDIKGGTVDNPDLFRISKMEEQYALEFIKKYLIPQNFKDYNSIPQVQRFEGMKNTSEQEVRQNLKKISHFKYTNTKSDTIGYESIIFLLKNLGAMKFSYVIFKHDLSGNLMIRYWNTLQPRLLFAKVRPDSSIIKEDIEDNWWHITKEEENRTLQYIREKFYTEYGDLVGQKIKKLKHELNPDKIVYGGWVKPGHWIGFEISKDEKGLRFSRLDKGQKESKVFWRVTNDSPLTEEGEILPFKVPISKEEEQRGLQYIRKKFIPNAVNSWNKRSYSPVDEKDIRQNMKKISATPIYMLYKSPTQIPEMFIDFYIFKNSAGRLMAGWKHGFSVSGEVHPVDGR